MHHTTAATSAAAVFFVAVVVVVFERLLLSHMMIPVRKESCREVTAGLESLASFQFQVN